MVNFRKIAFSSPVILYQLIDAILRISIRKYMFTIMVKYECIAWKERQEILSYKLSILISYISMVHVIYIEYGNGLSLLSIYAHLNICNPSPTRI